MIRRLVPALALLLAPAAALALSIPPVAQEKLPFPVPPGLEELPVAGGPPELSLPETPVEPPFQAPPEETPPTAPLASASFLGNGDVGPPFGLGVGGTPPLGKPEGVPPTPNTPALGEFPLAGFVSPPGLTQVPEPATVWLLGAGGMVGLAWWGRRRAG
jgi:hypothetical protein